MLRAYQAVDHEHSSPWRQAFSIAWRVYLPIRLTLLVIGIIIEALGWSGPTINAGSWMVERLVLRPWEQMDVDWYFHIAHEGYGLSDGRASFHPLFPLLISILGRLLGGHYLLAGFIVNDLACLGALMVFYRLFALDYQPAIAYEAVQWLLIVPIGFVLLIPYTEALTLCLIGFTIWFWRHKRWLAAGLCGCLAVLTKQPAIALLPALVIDYIYRYRQDFWRWKSLKIALALSLIPLGYVLFSVYRALIIDHPSNHGSLASLIVSPDLNKFWNTRFGMPWETFSHIAQYGFGATDWVFWIEMVLSLLALVIFCYSIKYYRKEITIFGFIQVGLISTIILPYKPDPILSFPRRFFLIPTIFLQLAFWSSSNTKLIRYLRLISFGLMLILSAAYATNQFTP